MKKIGEMLEGLRPLGTQGAVLIARDGTILAADIPEGENLESFAIMMATIIGAAVTASNQLKRSPPGTVISESEDLKIVIYSKGGKAFLAFILPKGKSVKKILQKSDEILKKVESGDFVSGSHNGS
jgi:predicted regulator of Ras-like GTPase activity (Roadblock/LC7/MglB family)